MIFNYNNIDYDEAAAIERLNRIHNLRVRSGLVDAMQHNVLGRLVLRIIELVTCGCCAFRNYTRADYDWLDDYQFLQAMRNTQNLNHRVIRLYNQASRHYNYWNPQRFIAIEMPRPQLSSRSISAFNGRSSVNASIAANAAAERRGPPPAPLRTPSTFTPYIPPFSPPPAAQPRVVPPPPPRAQPAFVPPTMARGRVGDRSDDARSNSRAEAAAPAPAYMAPSSFLPRSQPMPSMARGPIGDRSEGGRPVASAAMPTFVPPPQPQNQLGGESHNGRGVVGGRAKR